MRKLCCQPGCDDLAEPGAARCADHLAVWRVTEATRKAAPKARAVAVAGAELYATVRWRKARLWYLDRYPLCRDCAELGGVVVATDVDHVIPHRGDARLFWDQSNWQGLCKACHSRKTAREVWHQA